jgi:3-phenylpropionate/trans-cinnamate dioxygenase ferredoxin subunit
MSILVEVGKTTELKDGTMKGVFIEGHNVLIARVKDSYYAADNHCPHMGRKLSEGKLEGTVVTCPGHSSQFDLKDGKVVRWLKGSGVISAIGKTLKSPRPLNVYKVKVEDDRVMVEI